MAANVALEEGVQECLESLQDLKANNGEARYLKGLDQKIDDVEKRHIITELGTALFVVSSTLILKFGIATVALTGAVLLIRGEIDIPLVSFCFLLVASRLLRAFGRSIAESGRCDFHENKYPPYERDLGSSGPDRSQTA